MNHPVYLLFIGVFIITSCSQERKVLKKKKSKETIIKLERKSMFIELDNNSLDNYHTQVALSRHNNRLSSPFFLPRKQRLSGQGSPLMVTFKEEVNTI